MLQLLDALGDIPVEFFGALLGELTVARKLEVVGLVECLLCHILQQNNSKN